MDNADMSALLDGFAELVAAKLAERIGTQRAQIHYTVPQLAERYGLSQDAIRKRIRAGEFGETINVGSKTHRVTAEGVAVFEAMHTGPAYDAAQHPAARRQRHKHADPGRI